MTISRREAINLSSSALAGLSMVAMTPEGAQAQVAQPGPKKKWWMDEPVRYALVLYAEDKPPIDTDRFVQQLVDLNVNTVNLPTAGIAAYYPTKIPFHHICPAMPPGRDFVGEIVKKAHARGIHVVARFEFDMTHAKGVYEAHPEWMQRDAKGQPKIWNTMNLTCVNGGWQQEQLFRILDEVMDKYPIDGMVFNSGPQRQIDGHPCYCDNCKRLYRAKYNADIPELPDAQYNAFIAEASRTLADKMAAFVRAKRPDLCFMAGSDPDAFTGETHSAPVIGQSAFWLYQSSEAVNRARAMFPERMKFSADDTFADGSWRFAHHSVSDGESRCYQNLANGTGPYLFVNGTLDQPDKSGIKGVRPAFQFAKDHEELYVRQENAARVLLLEPPGGSGGRGERLAGDWGGSGPGGGGGAVIDRAAGNGGFGYADNAGPGGGGGAADASMRGFFRILTEQHVPFVLSSDLSWIDTDPKRYDLVVSYRNAPAALDKYLRQGGRVLAAGATKPELELPSVVKLWKRQETQSAYWRVQDRALLPSLKDTSLVFFYSDYLELEPRGSAALTLIPTSKVQPMELVGGDMTETTKPGLYVSDYGQGKLAYIPWDIGDLYYRASSAYHSAIVGDLVDYLLPKGRQIITNAHPMIQMTLQQQKRQGRTLVHFVNLSGCSQSAYHPAFPVSGIQVSVAGDFNAVRMASQGRDLPIRKSGGYVNFTLPSLDTYDVVVLT